MIGSVATFVLTFLAVLSTLLYTVIFTKHFTKKAVETLPRGTGSAGDAYTLLFLIAVINLVSWGVLSYLLYLVAIPAVFNFLISLFA